MHAHRSSPRTYPHPRTLRILLALLYLVALSLLIVWEYHDRLDVLSVECDFRDQPKSLLYSRAYPRILSWASPATPAHVVTVAIPQELEEIQSNLCLGRAYLADVLHVLATQNPGVVVIDKFYSPNACASTPASTNDLVSAVKAINVPVVIGESSDGTKETVKGACLVRKPQLDFAATNVVHGLTRVNEENERFPLRWLIFDSSPQRTEPGKPEAEPQFGDSLALAAVKAYDPTFVARPSIQRLIHQDDHAYANLDLDLPAISTTDLLCSAHDPALAERWSLACAHARPLPRMLGKIVLIGAENQSDIKHVLNEDRWGYELQARYIESLLAGDYLNWLPIAVSFVLFATFVFLIEGVPTILLAYRPRWKHRHFLCFAYQRRRYVWIVFWAVAIIVVSAAASLALRYLPPLLVYGDILFVTITRLVYFSAESAEHPFLHSPGPHTHKEHAMPTHLPPSGTVPPVDDGHLPTNPNHSPNDPDDGSAPVQAPTINKPGTEGGTPG